MGLEWERPAIGVRQATFADAATFHETGGCAVTETPDAFGPRNDGHALAASRG
jgi:hypothetical protein